MLREIRSDVEISAPFDPGQSPDPAHHPPRRKYIALWDTGATGTTITKRVAAELQLQPVGMVLCHHAQGRTTVPRYLVNLFLPSRVGVPMLSVVETDLSGGIDVLIGMDVISMGDFLISNHGSKTCFSFQLPSLKLISLKGLHEAQTVEAPKPSAAAAGAGRNSRCACGSGKKFKRCCGILPQAKPHK